jgi:hypothetical protein
MSATQVLGRFRFVHDWKAVCSHIVDPFPQQTGVGRYYARVYVYRPPILRSRKGWGEDDDV